MQIGIIIDGTLGILLMVFLYRGILRGFSGEIIGLVGLFAALFSAWKFADPAVILVKRYIGDVGLDDTALALMCGLVIFFVVEIIFAIIGWILSYMVRVTKLSFTDHVMGAVIGVLKTFAIAICVYVMLSAFSAELPDNWMENSYAMKAASYVWPPLRDLLTKHGLLDLSAILGEPR